MFKLIATFLKGDPQNQKFIDEYLSKSVDRVDLERREKELQRNGYLR